MVFNSKEPLVKMLESHLPKQYERYNRLSNRGIDFTVTQIHLMFIPRGFGKTFMSMCEVMDAGSQYDEFAVSFSKRLGDDRIPTLIPKDADAVNHHIKIDYLNKLVIFAEEYFREYNAVREEAHRLIFTRRGTNVYNSKRMV